MPAIRVTKEMATITVVAEEAYESPEDIHKAPEGSSATSLQRRRWKGLIRHFHEMRETHGIWCWCDIVVEARYAGLVGISTLGGCSYESEEEFKSIDGYYPDMVDEALAELQTQINNTYSLIHVEDT